MKYTFIFVCQAGKLEPRAMLLAASLKENLRCKYEMIAAIPQPKKLWGGLRPETLAFFKEMGVKCRPIRNLVNNNFPIGNKVSCLLIKPEGKIVFFLDTDIMCIKKFRPKLAKRTAVFAVKEQRRFFRLDREALNMLRAMSKLKSDANGHKTNIPYFNTGVIALKPNIRLGRAWLKCCKFIDQHREIPIERQRLDQLAFAHTVVALKLKWKFLDINHNHPSRSRPIDKARPPIFAHYHSTKALWTQKFLREKFWSFALKYPAIFIAFRNIYYGSSDYNSMIAPYRNFLEISA